MPALLTIDEAAAELAVGPRMIRRMLDDSRLTKIHVGRHVRCLTDEVLAYAAPPERAEFAPVARPPVPIRPGCRVQRLIDPAGEPQ